jgi:hypothetical protein
LANQGDERQNKRYTSNRSKIGDNLNDGRRESRRSERNDRRDNIAECGDGGQEFRAVCRERPTVVLPDGVAVAHLKSASLTLLFIGR